MLYLDHQLKTPISKNVKDIYLRYLDAQSMDAPYLADRTLIADYNQAVADIHEMLDIGPDATFTFLSSSSEGIAHVLQGVFVDHISQEGKNQILTTTIEDADTVLSLERFETLGVNTVQIPLNSKGILTVDLLKAYVSPRSCLLSISLASRLTGVIQPVQEIATFCKEHHILLHVDITSCIGNQLLSVKELGADFITFEGSRIGSVIGTGGLIVQNYHKLSPLIPSPMEGCTRGGPIHVAGLFALHAALKEKMANLDEVCIEVARLRNYFETALMGKINAKIFHKQLQRLPNVSCFGLPFIHAQLLVFLLSQKEIYVSFGGGQSQRLEHILEATGVGAIFAKTGISLSFTHHHTIDQINVLIEVLLDIKNRYHLFSNEIYQEVVHDATF